MTLPHDFSQCRPYNAATDFVDLNVARGLSGKVAFTDPTRTLTYGELQTATCRFGDGLRALGIRRESRIVLLLLDTVDYPVAFWGAIRAGIVPVPLNTLLTPEQYAYVLEDSRAEAILLSPPLVKAIEAVLGRLTFLKSAILVGAEPIGPATVGHLDTYRLEDVLDRGTPKLFTAPTLSSAAKLFFAYGLGNSMSFPMAVGASTVLLPDRPTPEKVLDTMQRHHPTIFYGVPTLYAALLANADIGPGAGSDRLRLCVSAGEALPPPVGERWRAAVGVDILDGIGSTEMLHVFVSNRPDDIRYGTSGKPVPGYEAKIIGEDDHELGAGAIGELVVRGPSAAEGYWNQRAKSRRTFGGEWTYTGDKYTRDADGYYTYCGRTDDMFKVSGIWVSPFEVEAALASHEAVLEAAVIGRKDADGLLKPKAFIVLKKGYMADEHLFDALKAHVKERAGPWKYPRWIAVRTELPKTATGKIQRFKLREEDAQT